MYTHRFVCKSCKNYLSQYQVMYSGGVCPHCGHHKPGTMLDVYSVVGQWVGHLWWRKWVPGKRENDEGA